MQDSSFSKNAITPLSFFFIHIDGPICTSFIYFGFHIFRHTYCCYIILQNSQRIIILSVLDSFFLIGLTWESGQREYGHVVHTEFHMLCIFPEQFEWFFTFHYLLSPDLHTWKLYSGAPLRDIHEIHRPRHTLFET